jgi:hypothetical protein
MKQMVAVMVNLQQFKMGLGPCAFVLDVKTGIYYFYVTSMFLPRV